MDTQEDEKPSKTRRKAMMHELQALGVRLIGLNREQLAAMGLTEELREAIEEAQRLKPREARRRQLQFIGRLMREVDPGPIRERLAVWEGRSSQHAAQMHRIEEWRERLLADDLALRELAAEQPGIDTRRLRSLVRGARVEIELGRPPKNFRELFRALREQLN